jgi:chloramphenicol O-acetyltransferase type A
MNCTKIDVQNWERKDLFTLYTTDLKLVMNMTADIDVTNLLRFTKKHGLKFYPTMIWVVSKRINARDEFKYCLTKEGELLKWDYVSPSYTDFNPQTEKFVKFVSEYSDDLFTFHDRVMADRAKHKDEVGFVPNQPENFFDISCLPWTRYNSFDVHVYGEGLSLFPIVIWGKYQEEKGKIMMPVSMNIHHAVCDGFHLCRFFKELQEEIDALGKDE